MPWGSPEERGHAYLVLQGEKLISKDEIHCGVLQLKCWDISKPLKYSVLKSIWPVDLNFICVGIKLESLLNLVCVKLHPVFHIHDLVMLENLVIFLSKKLCPPSKIATLYTAKKYFLIRYIFSENI